MNGFQQTIAREERSIAGCVTAAVAPAFAYLPRRSPRPDKQGVIASVGGGWRRSAALQLGGLLVEPTHN